MDVLVTRGFAVIDKKNGLIIASPHRRRLAFEKQLRASGWVDTPPHSFWDAGENARHWHAPNSVPDSVIAGAITGVIVARSTSDNDIVYIHWGNNMKAAENSIRNMHRIIKK